MYLSHAYSRCGLLRLIRLVVSVLASFWNKLKSCVFLALLVEVTRLVVLVSEVFFSFWGVGTPFHRFLDVVAIVTTNRLGFRRVFFLAALFSSLRLLRLVVLCPFESVALKCNNLGYFVRNIYSAV